MNSAAALILGFTMLAAACSSGSGEAQTIATVEQLATEATAEADTAPTTESETTTTTEAETTSTTESADTEHADADLEGRLLQLADLPTGWTTSDTLGGGDDERNAFCSESQGTFEQMEAIPDQVRVETDFQESDFGPFVSQSIVAFSTTEDAKQAIALFAQQLDECQSFVNVDGLQTTMKPLSFGTVRDETYAARMEIADDTFPFEADLVLVREDNLVSYIAHIAVLALEPGRTEAIVNTAAGRLG